MGPMGHVPFKLWSDALIFSAAFSIDSYFFQKSICLVLIKQTEHEEPYCVLNYDLWFLGELVVGDDRVGYLRRVKIRYNER